MHIVGLIITSSKDLFILLTIHFYLNFFLFKKIIAIYLPLLIKIYSPTPNFRLLIFQNQPTFHIPFHLNELHQL